MSPLVGISTECTWSAQRLDDTLPPVSLKRDPEYVQTSMQVLEIVCHVAFAPGENCSTEFHARYEGECGTDPLLLRRLTELLGSVSPVFW